mmetsp:Transcript_6881/g.25701  ORF Transcript_6881/g.25701 Transcript_6881/m.25701 type:complete len:121 (+) Transcript_6881:433-795(+)
MVVASHSFYLQPQFLLPQHLHQHMQILRLILSHDYEIGLKKLFFWIMKQLVKVGRAILVLVVLLVSFLLCAGVYALSHNQSFKDGLQQTLQDQTAETHKILWIFMTSFMGIVILKELHWN